MIDKGGTGLHGGKAGITLEVFRVVGISVAVDVLRMGASTSAGGLLELESNDFREFTSPPELAATRSLISDWNEPRFFSFAFSTSTTST